MTAGSYSWSTICAGPIEAWPMLPKISRDSYVAPTDAEFAAITEAA